MLLLASAGSAVGQVQLHGIGVLPGGFERSVALGVSADGSTVVGKCLKPDEIPGVPGDEMPVIWSAAHGLEALGSLGGPYGDAAAASADGQVIVGTSHTDPFGGGQRAFRWTRAGGMQNLGMVQGSELAFGGWVSADGSVVAGYVYSGLAAPFRWTNPIGMQALTPGGHARGMSSSGQVILIDGLPDDVLWTPAGVQTLPIPTGWPMWEPWFLSADGTTVAGFVADHTGSPIESKPYRWSAARGFEYMPHLGPDTDSYVYAISPDASILMGESGGIPTVWSQGTVQTVPSFLIARGVDVTGWAALEISGFSADKRTIVGFGVGSSGQTEGWIVALPAVCYPNCDASTTPPTLNVNDFQCFVNAFAAAQSYANCDGSTVAPVLNVNDFQCFVNAFAAGCS